MLWLELLWNINWDLLSSQVETVFFAGNQPSLSEVLSRSDFCLITHDVRYEMLCMDGW